MIRVRIETCRYANEYRDRDRDRDIERKINFVRNLFPFLNFFSDCFWMKWGCCVRENIHWNSFAKFVLLYISAFLYILFSNLNYKLLFHLIVNIKFFCNIQSCDRKISCEKHSGSCIYDIYIQILKYH
jgi:hypothetical protein